MGEWSKLVGEHGEEIVATILELVGWGNNRANIDINCTKPEKHKTGSNPRKKHGIDFVFSYKSELEERTVCHAVISSKFTADKYPNNPTETFKSHFLSLAKDVECFKKSPIRKENASVFTASRDKCFGVLFWLSNEENESFDLLDKIYSVKNIDDIDYSTIYVIDNMRAAFVYDTIISLRHDPKISSVNFLYMTNGSNNSAADRLSSGKIMPVEFLNSGIIPLSITTSSGESILAISCMDKTDEPTLKRLIGLAQGIAYDFPGKVLICLPDFNPLKHKEILEGAKSAFPDVHFIEKITIKNIKDSFRGSQQ